MSDQDSAKPAEILEKLKSAILNIDWEISDENIGLLNQELAVLRTAWEGQKVHLIYLQILGALGQYIAMNKEKANPGAFPMLRNVFASLEELVVSPGDEEALNKKVMEHVDAYNELKKAIATGSAAPAAQPEEAAAPEPPAEPEPEPEPQAEAEPEPEPELELKLEEDEEGGEEESSTINRLLDDKEDHTTDSIFDSMLDEMVQADQPPEEEKPAPAPPPPKAPPGRPPVQAAYNKEDGTEIEADRNIEEDFEEADALLDDFFEDDVPPPSAAKKGGEFDLSALDEEEGDVLDLGEAAERESAGEEETLELSMEAEEAAPAGDVLEDKHEETLELVEDSELDIFKIDEEEQPAEPAPPTAPAAKEEPEMEAALDDFFADEGEAGPQEPSLTTPLEVEKEEEEVEAALEDFFAEEEPEGEGTLTLGGEEETAGVVSTPSCSVEDLKSLLLSVDWEVDDKLLERVDGEIVALKEKMADNHTALIHLNFLATVIHHIGREQAQVISESMTCLKMITESLESLLTSGKGDEAQWAAKAAAAFTDWHELVVAEFEKRLDEARKQSGELAESIEGLQLSSDAEESSETTKLKAEILAEVREILSQEMRTIRQEISQKN